MKNTHTEQPACGRPPAEGTLACSVAHVHFSYSSWSLQSFRNPSGQNSKVRSLSSCFPSITSNVVMVWAEGAWPGSHDHDRI